MKAFVKSGDNWFIEGNQNLILNAEECVFADDIKAAVKHINIYLNKFYPDFDIVYHSNPWARKEQICTHKHPILRNDVSAERTIELIKKAKVYVKDSILLKSKLEKELGISLLEIGITRLSGSFNYNPELAKRELKRLKRKYKPKSNFIQMNTIVSTNLGMLRIINNELKKKSPYLEIEAIRSYGNRTKIQTCRDFFSIKICIDNLFGKYSYRHIVLFQKLKNEWTKKKPKSAIAIGVTEKFFDFMEEEITKRKPRKKEFKLRWK